MKTQLICVGLLLLAGCGQNDGRQPSSRIVYPALNESPLPPPPPVANTTTAGQLLAKPADPPAEVRVDSEYQKEGDKLDLVKRLREYAAKAAPGDPFALTEKEIDALSKLDNPVFN